MDSDYAFLTYCSTRVIITITMRGGAEAARRAHNPKVVGSNPTPAIGNKMNTAAA